MSKVLARTGLAGDALELVQLDGSRFALRDPKSGAIRREVDKDEALRILHQPGTLHFGQPMDIQTRGPC